MSSASNPFFSLETFTPPPPMPVHPMITMPGYTQPFTLLRTGDLIQVTFTNQASANVRVLISHFPARCQTSGLAR